jgi:hypothetical protein
MEVALRVTPLLVLVLELAVMQVAEVALQTSD